MGSHSIAHITNESSQLPLGVMLNRTCLAHSGDCNAVVIASEYVFCVIKSGARKEFRAFLLRTIYDDLVAVRSVNRRHWMYGAYLGRGNTVNDTCKFPQVFPEVPILHRVLV